MRLPAVLVYLTALLLSQQLSPCESLRVAAFNIRQFGDKKSKNLWFMGQLTTFICKQEWDLAFLQELTDFEVFQRLRTSLNNNNNCKRKLIRYHGVASEQHPVEAIGGKEIHAYIYRNDKMKRVQFESHQHEYEVVIGNAQLKLPVFFRPPFVLQVKVFPKTVPELGCMQTFVLIGMHTRPYRTYGELNGLVEVYDWARKKYKQDALNALILGDLNADVPYFGPVDREQNPLYAKGCLFKWLVEDGKTTNYGKKSKTYDRIIAAGDQMKKVACSKTVKIPTHHGILSDHRPVSVDLNCPKQKGQLEGKHSS